ncbi:glycosyltransferase [Ancylobacter lacus]|uniref:glycosyltransferase n=1 Tax=Ancylobacter lacus TaxID=2579970 RepID=UPI001BD11E7A|nr:glycosyltransferase family 2 protein [Ancylobacter lacus]MBS7538580.1 glycosyltransferase family 2 protein [Ancylobacter lacus]
MSAQPPAANAELPAPADRPPAGAAPAPAPAPELTLVIPTFNEAGNIAPLIARLQTALAGLRWEAIFVDDNSPDGTADALREAGRRDSRIRCIRRIGRRGLAGACIEGILAAQAPVAAVMDADLQHDETLLPRMFAAMGDGADVVVATRYAPGGEASSFGALRGFGSRFANGLAHRLLGVRSSDPMSGFFMLRRELVERLAPKLSSEGFKILLDILATAGRDVRVEELTYTFGVRHSGESKLQMRVLVDFAGLILAKATGGAVSLRFLSFAAVGALGLGVHLLALRLGLGFGARFEVAQAVATLVAMTFNFFLNNATTYRDRRLRGWAILPGLAGFYAICGLGAAANVGVAGWMFYQTSRWWVAGVAGACIGAVWNYGVSKALVWREPS